MKKKELKSIALIAFIVGQSFFLTHLYLSHKNTLKENSNWSVTKATSQFVPIMGGEDFYSSANVLSRNMLNLGSWHGNQEIYFKKKISPKEIQFRYYPSSSEHLFFLIKDKPDTYLSIEFSSSFVSFLSITYEGEILSKQRVGNIKLKSDWNSIKVKFENEVVIYLNENFIGTVNKRFLSPVEIGFRGCQSNCYLDDIVIYTDAREKIIETFSNRKGMWSIFGTIFIVLIIANVSLSFFLKKTNESHRENQLLVNFGFLLSAGLMFTLYFFYFSHLYQRNENDPSDVEDYFVKEKQIIERKFAASVGNGEERILFIGSSQTYGEGASLEDKTWVPLACTKINNRFNSKRRFQCVNFGIRSAVSKYFVKYYSEIVSLKPKYVVIVLSNNDVSPDDFNKNIKKIILLNLKNNIKTILIPEVDQSPLESSNNKIVKELGKSYQLPIIELKEYLNKNSQRGFLWWDQIHLTDFGQRLLAEKISNDLIEILNIQ